MERKGLEREVEGKETHMLRYLIASVDISSVFQTQQQDTWMSALLKLGVRLRCCNWQIHFHPQSTGISAIVGCVGRGIVCQCTDVWLNSILCDISLVEHEYTDTVTGTCGSATHSLFIHSNKSCELTFLA